MRLDVNELNHNYILRLVILAVFMYKKMRKQELAYTEAVRSFVEKRLGYDTELTLEVGPKMNKSDTRKEILTNLLENVDDEDRGVYNLVALTFKTGYKEVNMQINLNEPVKYQEYIYG